MLFLGAVCTLKSITEIY